MATDVAAVRAAVIQERAQAAAVMALFDLDAETIRFQNAEAVWRDAQAVFRKASRRQQLIADTERRISELDAQIDLLTP